MGTIGKLLKRAFIWYQNEANRMYAVYRNYSKIVVIAFSLQTLIQLNSKLTACEAAIFLVNLSHRAVNY